MWGLIVNRSRDVARQVSRRRCTCTSNGAAIRPCHANRCLAPVHSRHGRLRLRAAKGQRSQMPPALKQAIEPPAYLPVQALGYIPASQPELQDMFCR